MEDAEEFTIYDLSIKCKSKTVLFNLFTREHLPPFGSGCEPKLSEVSAAREEKIY